MADPKIMLRWLIQKDMKQVMKIEDACFEQPWSERDFQTCLKQRNCIGMVAECKDLQFNFQVVGFVFYELHKTHLRLINFAVSAEMQRKGVGTKIMASLIKKLNQQSRDSILLNVRETNLPAQLFFQSVNFKAVGVVRDHYEDPGEDAYVMKYNDKS
jgi:ribosomal-protein-alanine N-acetyltransferase